jgi:Putative inner membrane exporter, YdcZ
MNANAGWIIPFIIFGGALQSCGAAMNGQLNKHVVNPWLASAISFALITFFFTGASLIHPHPLPIQKGLAEGYSLAWLNRGIDDSDGVADAVRTRGKARRKHGVFRNFEKIHQIAHGLDFDGMALIRDPIKN